MRKLVAAALFAVFLVPHALAAGRAVAPAPIIPTRHHSPEIEVATAGGRFLTVWNAPGTDYPIYGALSDANGHRISPAAFLIAQNVHPNFPALAVAGTDDSFAVFWADDARAVHMTDVALDGRVLGDRTLALPTAEHVSVAWDGERFLVAIFRENQFINRSVAALVARDGTILRGDILLDRTARPAHVAAHADGFLVFGTGRDFIAHVIGNDGSARQLIAGDPGGAIVSSRIDDETLLIVYAMSDGQMRSALWKNGAKLNEITITVERFITTIGILSVDDGHLLAYATDDGLFTIRLGLTGAPASEPLLLNDSTDFFNADARGASNGTVLLMPHRFRETIAAATLDRSRTVGARETLSVHPAAQSHVLMGAGGGSMIAVFHEKTSIGEETRIRAALIGRDYETKEIHEIAPEGTLRARTLGWSGTDYLVVYQWHDQLFAARLAYDGAPIGEPRALGFAELNVRAAVTWAGDRWAVAWKESNDHVIRYATVSRAGIPSPVQEVNVTQKPVLDVALAFDGNRVHLAWIEAFSSDFFEAPSGYAVFTTRLRRNGRVFDATPLSIFAEGPSHIAMASDGDRIVLSVDQWDRSNQQGRTMINVIDASTRALLSRYTLHRAVATRTDVTWTGYEFVAAVGYYHDDLSPALAIWHLGEDPRFPGPPRVAETEAVTLDVSVAASPGYDAVAGLDEFEAAPGRRAVIYPEREMARVP